jgi:hypothetical protein
MLLSAGGGSLLSEIHSAIFALQAYENTVLAERNANNDAQLDLRDDISTILLATSTLVVVGAGILFLRILQLQNIIAVCAWTQRVNYRGKWMRMEEFLWQRFRVKVSHGISEEAFDGVMGLVGKNLTIPDNRGDRPPLGGTDGPKTKLQVLSIRWTRLASAELGAAVQRVFHLAGVWQQKYALADHGRTQFRVPDGIDPCPPCVRLPFAPGSANRVQ